MNEAEALAVLCALLCFQEFLVDVDLTVYIDSAAALGAIRNAYSRSQYLACIAGEIFLWCDAHGVRLWLEQVPSKLNPADPLSRLDLSHALTSGWVKMDLKEIKWSAFDPTAIS